MHSIDELLNSNYKIQVQQVVRFSIENANSPSCLLPLDTGQTMELLIPDHSVTDHVYLCSTCKVEC